MYRDQAQPEVADLDQQSVQRRLISQLARNDRLGAIAANPEAAEPVRPPVIEDAIDTDLVVSTTLQAAHARSPPRRTAGLRPGPGKAFSTMTTNSACPVSMSPASPGPVVQRSSLRTTICHPSVGPASFTRTLRKPPRLRVTRRCACGWNLPERALGTTVLPVLRLSLVMPGTPPDTERSCGSY